MQGTPTWTEALESLELYKKLSPDQKKICDETGVLPGKSASKKNPRLNRLTNDKKLALSCIEEIINSTARPGKLLSGGTIYGHWYKDNVTLEENIMSEKKNVRLCPRSGLIPCIRRWFRIVPRI
ncbi:hypothetical protein DSO57_1020298 [Entomophthora muscae]|uniref:Uncharacterized protein n=1 Tax=Entomophthora muscae TaxID=34485 RepID=A0ACC2RUW3_9FUNG|nr:hypothetical protein DSO57_1020298 [Entomophthora muscae]